MEALQTATRNAAQYPDILDSYGTVEKGKTADLVVLDANPLTDIRMTDIRNTQKISGVMIGAGISPGPRSTRCWRTWRPWPIRSRFLRAAMSA